MHGAWAADAGGSEGGVGGGGVGDGAPPTPSSSLPFASPSRRDVPPSPRGGAVHTQRSPGGALAHRAPPATGEVHSVGEGQYVAEYLVQTAGVYLLDVRVGRELIVGSPFRLTVEAGPPHPPSCRVLRRGPEKIRAGQTALLCFESCDRHGNRRMGGGDGFVASLTIGDDQPAAAAAAARAARAAQAARAASAHAASAHAASAHAAAAGSSPVAASASSPRSGLASPSAHPSRVASALAYAARRDSRGGAGQEEGEEEEAAARRRRGR